MEIIVLAVAFYIGWVIADIHRASKKPPRTYLHEHGDLGWHAHPYDRNHVHRDDDLDGPFAYVDEIIIDQRGHLPRTEH